MTVGAEDGTTTALGRQKRPAVAAALSALIPGAGQWYAGRPRRAAIVFGITVLAVLIVAAITASRDIVGIVELLVQPRFLWVLLGANALVLAWRIFAVVDAYTVTSSASRKNVASIGVAAVIVVLVAAPHVGAANYGMRAIVLLEEVFVTDEEAAAPATRPTVLGPAIPSPEITPDPLTIELSRPDTISVELSTVGLLFQEGIGDPDAIAAARTVATEQATEPLFLPFSERVGDQRITILLAGGDAGPGREGLRTDTMIIATIDTATGEAALFGLPRNFKRVPLPAPFENAFAGWERNIWERKVLNAPDADGNGYPDTWVDRDGDLIPDQPGFTPCRCFPEMLNKVRERTLDWTETYPGTVDPGMEALRDVVANLLELPIDYYMLVDMAGFVRLIDAIGGIDVMVTDPLHVKVSAPAEGTQKAVVHVEPGMNHLDGFEALAYVRWRRGQSDYVRMQRQRCLIRSVVAQATPTTLLRSFPAIADAIQTSVVTDIPISFLPDLVEITSNVDFGSIATIGFVPPRYNKGRTEGGYPIPHVDRIRDTVQDVLENGVVGQSDTGESECGI